MLGRLRGVLLPRLLFLLTAGLALALLLAVVLAPWLLEDAADDSHPQLLLLFARDVVVRRTAVASGLGLFVTACVFFRPAPAEDKSEKPPKRRPPDRIAGA